MVWLRHTLKIEEELEEDDPYYEMDFPTIIKYIPEFIWWNNGLFYRNGNKNFYFTSLGFFHLAKGGSIRNAPDHHHFTRRMAKVFVNLPFDFNQGNKDMYIYCYGKSLGAGDLLSETLQHFFRHHATPQELQDELEKWNPIIQKLSNSEFEELSENRARDLLGYLYHCLRDKVGFTVQRRTIAQLIQESNAYYERIQIRAAQRAEVERARLERIKKAKKKDTWEVHEKVKPYKKDGYKIIELTTRIELENEGSVMNHCVGSYMHMCKTNKCSIWSLRERRKDVWYSRVTIELNRANKIVQSSARFNATPSKEHFNVIKEWADLNKIPFNN